MTKKRKLVVNPKKRELPGRNPKKGDRIEYQWDEKGLKYEKGEVQRGGANIALVKWDSDSKTTTVDIKGREGWWFFESGNAAKKKKKKNAWKPPPHVPDVVEQALTRAIPPFMKSDILGPAPAGKHKVAKFYQREKYKIGGETMNCSDRLNMIFTTHIRFTKKHVLYPKKHFCRCQRIELVPGHSCTPPKGVECLVLWIKIEVAKDVHSDWGGAPTTMPSLIICHLDKALANGVATMPIYEVNISAVKHADKGLQCMICEQVGLIQALQIKFHK